MARPLTELESAEGSLLTVAIVTARDHAEECMCRLCEAVQRYRIALRLERAAANARKLEQVKARRGR